MPAVTEIILAVGAGDRLVGRAEFDVDSSLAHLPLAGGVLDPSLEVLVAAAEICDPRRRSALGLEDPAEFDASWDGPFSAFALTWMGSRVISGLRPLLLRSDLESERLHELLRSLEAAEQDLLTDQNQIRQRCRQALRSAEPVASAGEHDPRSPRSNLHLPTGLR